MPAQELVVTDPTVLETLYDPLRYRVFRVLEEPRTVAEVAQVVGMPANRLYYHVRRLVENGLIEQMPVTGSERVYRAKQVRFTGDVGLPEIGGPLRAIVTELASGEFGRESPGLLTWHVGPLTKRRARELERRMQALVAEYTDDKRGERFGILGVLARLPR
jgi:DNA-binding transcriptional ArsR family regulator